MTIKQKQHLLGFLGYYSDAVDGIWGPNSQQAMRNFQAKYGGSEDAALLAAVSSWDPVVPDINVGNKSDSWWDDIEFFARSEFKCTCGGRGCSGFPAEPRERLVRNADAVRKNFGKPAIVSSGVRCELRNGELPGSAANSLHLSGRAMDIGIPGVSAAKLLAYIKTLPEVHEAYAIDECYVHMGVQKY